MRWTKRRVGGGFCGDSASAVSNENKCNSRKDKGKEFGHSGGALISVYPCGIISVIDKLFGSEGAAPVVGVIGKWTGSLIPETVSCNVTEKRNCLLLLNINGLK